MARGKRQKKSNTGKIAAIVAASAVAAGAILFTFTGIYAAKRDTIFPNVSISGVDVGGMTKEEAYQAVKEAGGAKSKDVSVTVKLTYETSLTVTGEDVGMIDSTADAVEKAMEYGRGGSNFTNTVSFIRSLFSENDMMTGSGYDQEKVRELVSETAAAVNKEDVAAGYTVGETEIVVYKGTSGYTVDEDAVFKYICGVFDSGESGSFETEEFAIWNIPENMSKSVDIDTIYNEVFVGAADATLDMETLEVIDEVIGVSFNVEEAKAAYDAAEDGEKVTIPLIFNEPEVTAESLTELLFRDCLAEKSTSLSTSSSNRINNVTKAAEAVNGTVLLPGDEFSFNGIVGERTEAKGYKPAGAYVGGESVDQIGGGICQVSSTIYYCTLKANLEITSRSNHMFSVAYLPLGFDATVNWGTIDFKFKNNQEYPIKLVASVKDKQLYVEIWGTKLDDTYVELGYNLIETIEYEVVMQEDEEIPQGTTKVKTSGHNGYIVDSYQIIYNGDGTVQSQNLLARNKYKAQNRVILIPINTEETEEPGTNPVDDPTPDEPTPEEPTPETPDEGGEAAPVETPEEEEPIHGI